MCRLPKTFSRPSSDLMWRAAIIITCKPPRISTFEGPVGQITFIKITFEIMSSGVASLMSYACPLSACPSMSRKATRGFSSEPTLRREHGMKRDERWTCRHRPHRRTWVKGMGELSLLQWDHSPLACSSTPNSRR